MYQILLLVTAVFALRYDSPVSTEPICVNKNTILTPPDLPIMITRIAWPVIGPPFNDPLTVNNAQPISSPTIMCVQCESPPCYPITLCDAQGLFWNVEFNNLVVQPGLIELSNSLSLPQVLTVYYEPWGPMPTPTSSPSPSVTPAAASATATLTPRQEVVCAPCISNNVCDKSGVVGTSVALAFLVVLVGVLAVFVRRKAKCPYCLNSAQNLRVHLQECTEHLKHFSPITIDRVRVVKEVVRVAAEGEDEVARPENVVLVG